MRRDGQGTRFKESPRETQQEGKPCGSKKWQWAEEREVGMVRQEPATGESRGKMSNKQKASGREAKSELRPTQRRQRLKKQGRCGTKTWRQRKRSRKRQVEMNGKQDKGETQTER